MRQARAIALTAEVGVATARTSRSAVTRSSYAGAATPILAMPVFSTSTTAMAIATPTSGSVRLSV